MLEIISKNNNKIKEAYALKMKKTRLEKGLFLMEGFKNLEMALAHGVVKTIFTSVPLSKVAEDIEVYKVNMDLIKKLASSKNPEGVVFVSEILKPRKKKNEYHKNIYLDRINDPGNLGTIIRSAAAFSYDAVILAKGSVDLYNEKVLASTKGSIFLIDVFYDDLANYKKSHKIIVSTIDKNSSPLSHLPKYDNFVLVVGSESHGVSEEYLRLADIKVNIPIDAKIDSLNVAIASGILMYHLK